VCRCRGDRRGNVFRSNASGWPKIGRPRSDAGPTFVRRIVCRACDKLFHHEKLNIVPQLTSSYEWSADSKALTIKVRLASPSRRRSSCGCGQVQHRTAQDHGRLESPR
jgi:hypothetical protein